MIAAITDLRTRTIPNWLVLAGLIAGFALNIRWRGAEGILFALAGMGMALLIYLPLYLLRAMGGGDVKLMAAAGAITGYQNWFVLFILASIIGGVVALCVVVFRGILWKTVSNVGHIAAQMLRLRAPHASREELSIDSSKAMTLPHGAVIAVAAILFVALLR